MLKKLSIAGLAFVASCGIAFADNSDSMPAGDASSMSSAATSDGTDASAASAATSESTTTTSTTKVVHKKHKKHHHKKHHKKHHYRTVSSASQAAPVAADQDPVTSAAPKGDYKGEIAAPCPTCHNTYMAGPYVGFSVGSRVNYVSTPSVYNGLEGTLLGGYGWLWDQWYGALEVFVQDSAAITNYTSSVGSARSTWGYGLSVLPGYTIVDNVLGYLRLGVVRSRFSTGNNWETGGQVGLGLDTVLCNNWDLRGEYVYSFYNSLSNNAGSPKAQQFNLGLVYKFQM